MKPCDTHAQFVTFLCRAWITVVLVLIALREMVA